MNVLKIKVALLVVTLTLIFSCIGFQLAYASDYPKLATDDEVKKYYGKVIESSKVFELIKLLMKKYPGHGFASIVKLVEADIKWTRDPRTGEPMFVIRSYKVMLVAIYDTGPLPDYSHNIDSVEPLWQHHYEVTLPPGYIYCHTAFYIEGIAVFESVTYWNVVSGSSGSTLLA